MTAFDSCFLFLNNPAGGVEDIAWLKQNCPWVKGVFCNVRDYAPNEWTSVRTRAIYHELFCGPWGRTTAPDRHVFLPGIVDLIIHTADAWNSPGIINSEVELDGNQAALDYIVKSIGTRDCAISMQSNPFDSIDWSVIGDIPILVQIFPVEAPGYEPIPTRNKWWSRGAKCVYMTYGTYGGMKPTDFPLVAPYSLFTGDIIMANHTAPLWSPTATGYQACKEASVPEIPWYKKPYPKGKAVGPAHLPRDLKPPSKNGGVVMTGHDVIAMKRMVSKAQRWLPWEPTNWDNRYNEMIAMGKGTGQVGESGLRGLQRQEGIPETGVLNDATYQLMRKILIPTGPNKGQHILDATSVKEIAAAAYELSDNAKYDKIRAAMTDFCNRAEAHESLWHYTQSRPFRGLGLDPEATHFGDCSGYVIMVYYWARQETGLNVTDPSGYRYSGYGNTGDNLDGHTRVTSGNYVVGDLAHYDGHVTICKKAGSADTSEWSSFGSEAGPVQENLFYRPDFIKVVRPPIMV